MRARWSMKFLGSWSGSGRGVVVARAKEEEEDEEARDPASEERTSAAAAKGSCGWMASVDMVVELGVHLFVCYRRQEVVRC